MNSKLVQKINLAFTRLKQPMCMAGLSNLRPARQYCVAREVIYILKVLDELSKEMMKPESTLLQSTAQLIHRSCYYDGFYSRNSLENL